MRRHLPVLILLLSSLPAQLQATREAWTSASYPDIRGLGSEKCKVNTDGQGSLYVCDPDQMLNKSQATALNTMLSELSTAIPCPCQRKSQCSGGLSGSQTAMTGFIVSIAILEEIQTSQHSPSEKELTNRAEGFCRSLEGKWALGDCGNSVIIFVWKKHSKIVIWPARLAEKYVTEEERIKIVSDVNELVKSGQWYSALSEVIGAVKREFLGKPQSRFDTGSIALCVSVGVAVGLTLIITVCVCSFRCCGNVKSEDGSVAGNSYLGRVDSLRNSIVRRGSSLRRSISRSPKFAQGPAFFFTENTIV